ncbi:MAG: DUF4112 domain-containing protein [Acidobacteriota bacterium]|nr:DUF4112 domain-containing protein [Acidobacteriota bacterium]
MPQRVDIEPEILPPSSPPGGRVRRAGSDTLTDENLEHLAALLDDAFRIPGTNLRFGLDAIIGLIPAVGDMLSSLASFIIIFAAWQRGLPQVTLARMVANVAVDTIVGAMPLVGDLFDLAWKANRMNMRLLQRDAEIRHRQTWRDWLFLLLIGLVLLGLALLPFVVLFWIVRLLRG